MLRNPKEFPYTALIPQTKFCSYYRSIICNVNYIKLNLSVACMRYDVLSLTNKVENILTLFYKRQFATILRAKQDRVG